MCVLSLHVSSLGPPISYNICVQEPFNLKCYFTSPNHQLSMTYKKVLNNQINYICHCHVNKVISPHKQVANEWFPSVSHGDYLHCWLGMCMASPEYQAKLSLSHGILKYTPYVILCLN